MATSRTIRMGLVLVPVLALAFLLIIWVATSEDNGPADLPGVGSGGPNQNIMDSINRLVQEGHTRRDKKYFEQAEKLLRQALKTHPKKDQIYTELGHLQMQVKLLESRAAEANKPSPAAREMFKKALGINPRNIRALEGLARLHEFAKEYKSALEADDKILQIAPENLPAWDHKGRILLLLKQYDKAEEVLVELVQKAKATRNQQALIFAQELLGTVYTRQGKYHQAEKVLLSAVERGEATRAAACPYVALGALYTAMGRQDKMVETSIRAAEMEAGKPQMQYLAAKNCYDNGYYEKALKYIQRAAALDNHPSYKALLRKIEAMKRRGPTEEEFKAALLSFNGHRFNEARLHISRALAGKERTQYKVVKGFLLLLEKKYQEAEELFKQASRSRPEDEAPRVGLGHLDIIRKDYASARKRLEPAIKSGDKMFGDGPLDDSARQRYGWLSYRMAGLGLGWMLANQNQHRGAMIYFGRILAREPEDIFALLGKGNSSNALNRLEDAEKYMRKVLNLIPNNQYALAELALVYYNRGQDKEAERLFKQALKENTSWRYTCPYEGLGMVYLRAGKLDKARDNFKKAIQNNPQNEYKKYNGLAKIMIRDGKYAKARELLNKSIKNYPYDKEAKELLQSIRGKGGPPPKPGPPTKAPPARPKTP